ncbi:MAG: hypothetical protein GX751_10715 [Desulfuromonadaceae bacterium]|nr:hypothetical protein [Desulfuromonadaceae bacterium]
MARLAGERKDFPERMAAMEGLATTQGSADPASVPGEKQRRAEECRAAVKIAGQRLPRA